jgi:hypothetical protein
MDDSTQTNEKLYLSEMDFFHPIYTPDDNYRPELNFKEI